jgi:16S rRNA (guanine1207-N2)-methyltransferase
MVTMGKNFSSISITKGSIRIPKNEQGSISDIIFDTGTKSEKDILEELTSDLYDEFGRPINLDCNTLTKIGKDIGKTKRRVYTHFNNNGLQKPLDMEDIPENELKPRNARGAKTKYRIEESLLGTKYIFYSVDGVYSKDEMDTKTKIMIESLKFEPTDRFLDVTCGYGAVGIVAADHCSDVIMIDHDLRAVNQASKNVKNSSHDIDVYLSDGLEEVINNEFNVVSYSPPAYIGQNIVNKTFHEIHKVLVPEGTVYTTVLKNQAKTIRRLMQDIFGESTKVKRKRNVIALKAKNINRFDMSEIPKEEEHIILENLLGENYEFCTKNGVFSKDSVDDATRFLIESINLNKDLVVADVGCGYGPLGISVADKVKEVHMMDSNIRAVKLAKTNVDLNHIKNINIYASDSMDAVKDKKFDMILSNPPTHAGTGVIKKLVSQAYKTLLPEGELYLVINKAVNYEPILAKSFGNYEKYKDWGQYKILKSIKT